MLAQNNKKRQNYNKRENQKSVRPNGVRPGRITHMAFDSFGGGGRFVRRAQMICAVGTQTLCERVSLVPMTSPHCCNIKK